jgi:outer membrane protein
LEEQPDFTGQVSTTERTDFALGLTAEWLLYDFGRSRLQVEAAKETVLATRQVLLGIEQQVLFRSVEAHINVLRNQENVQLRRNNLGVIREELRAAKERFELGETTQTDIAQAEARLSEAEPTRMPSTDMSEAVAKDVASSRHPDLLKIQREVNAADLNVQIAKAAMRPSINLTGRIGTSREIDGSDYSHSGSVGIEMSGPIYRGGSLSSAHRQAMARRAAARGELHLVSLQVRQNVGNAFARLRAARASRQASRDEVRAARIAFEGIRDEAQYGARTTLDILQSEQRFLNARTNSIFAKADVQIASYAVLAATGKLTARALNLDVPTYDPNTYYELSKTAPVSISPQGDKLDRVIRALGK